MDGYNSSYVNHSFAVSDEKKQDAKKGKFFWNIDFEFTNYLTEQNTAYGENPVVGNLIVGSHKMPVTLSEVNKLIETLHDVKITYDQKRKLKLYDLPKKKDKE
jgi:hypothetical protein